MAFYLRFERDGRRSLPADPPGDRGGPRAGLATGCATRCSSGSATSSPRSSEHFTEYVPWFIKRDRPDLIERFNIPLDEISAPLRGRRSPDWRQQLRARRWKTQTPSAQVERASRSHRIRLADHPQHGDRPAARRSTAMSPNHGLIDNLPRRLLRRGARAWSTRTASSRPASARCRRSWPR